MANKYHRQGFSKGKLVTSTVKKAREAMENIYKKDKTGKKDKLIDQLNKATKKQRSKFTKGDRITEEPKGLDFYTDVMTSDFEKKTGPYFDRIKKKKGRK
jgi:hypothetical protein